MDPETRLRITWGVCRRVIVACLVIIALDLVFLVTWLAVR